MLRSFVGTVGHILAGLASAFGSLGPWAVVVLVVLLVAVVVSWLARLFGSPEARRVALVLWLLRRGDRR